MNARDKARILRDKLRRRLSGSEIELVSAVADGHMLDNKHWRDLTALCDRHEDAIALQALHEPDLEGRELLGAALAGKRGEG